MTPPARKAVSVLGLLAVVAGMPAALVGLGGWPLPRHWPSAEQVRSALAEGWTPDEAFVAGVLALLAWVLWAQLLRRVVGALAVQRRAMTTGEAVPVSAHRHGLAPRVASWLVAGLFVAGPVLPSAALAGERPRIAAVLDDTMALAPLPASAPAPAVTVASEAAEVPAASYVVRTWEERRDCLWNIAERYLGDPMRWGELLELNAGASQPSGRSLADDPQHWVYPGMELRLPADAAGPDLRPASPPAGETGTSGAASPSPRAEPAPVATAPPSTVASPPATGTAGTPSATFTTSPAPTPTTVPADGSRVRRTAVPDPIPLGRDAMRLAAAMALGLPVFAAGGVALHLNRRRRIQVARHRPGRDMVRPDPELEPLERRIRAIAVDEASAWVDAALRTLGAELRRASLTAPRITCVRAGELGLEILLAEPGPEAPASFAALDDGQVWRLDPDLDLTELQRRAGNAVAPLPTLVSVGVSPEGPILVDLETLGVVSVEGDDARVGAFLAGAALELASVAWAEGVDLRVAGCAVALRTDGVRMVDDLVSLSEHLATTSASVSDALGNRSLTVAARLDEPGEEWLPTVAVVDDAGAAAALGELVGLVRPGSGVAVLGRGPIPGAHWRLSVVAEGFARLEGPTGLDFHELRATGWEPPAMETDVGDLDQAAIAGAASLLSAASHDDDVAPVVHLDGGEGPRPLRRCGPEHYDVWVDVLGPVEVSGFAEPVGRRRKLEELVVYLATHERPVPAERLRCAVWAEVEIASKSFIQAMSRARRHLGGQAHLPEAVGGAYRLGPDVGCSWSAFKELAAAAGDVARSDPEEAMALWHQALSLVRGEPFAGVTKGSYIWAWSEGLAYEMQVVVTRAADALGTLALAQDDPDTAEWAVRQGLLAMPTQLSLFDWGMRVAAHRNDLDGLNAAFTARRRAEEALDPLAEVPPETVNLFETLVAEVRGQRRARVRS